MRVLCVLFVGLFIAAGAFQAETVQAEDIVQDMSCKLNRGVFNVLTGWGELPRQMIKSGKATFGQRVTLFWHSVFGSIVVLNCYIAAAVFTAIYWIIWM